MAKFNTVDKRGQRTPTSPITSAPSGGITFEGGVGFERNAKGELFLLAVSNFVNEKTFYESGKDRDERFERLVHQVAVEDPGWLTQFIPWLRNGANMRSASLVAGVEAARALIAAGKPGGRQLIAGSMARADEPGEALAYWLGRYGRPIPHPVKRGIADAAARLYNEYGLLKYDTPAHAVRFGDVVDMTQPKRTVGYKEDLYRLALDRRTGKENGVPESLKMIRNEGNFRSEVAEGSFDWEHFFQRTDLPETLRAAGLNWEDVLPRVPAQYKKAAWEALAPSMGYMAALRNLRNFDEAGISEQAAAAVIARLSDPQEVARSRQLPFRFLAAQENMTSQRWGHALDLALQSSLANIPTLGGKTLVLVDTSASMTGMTFSARSKMTPAKAAALFGVALAAKGEDVDMRGFADGVFTNPVKKGSSVLLGVQAFLRRTGEVGHGTDINRAVRTSYAGHDRVVIISDMQTMGGYYAGDVSRHVPANIPVYGFNLGGYKQGAFAAGSGNRHEFGGLTDATFRMIPLLEAGKNASWPWENQG